jgi:hypothetical protein
MNSLPRWAGNFPQRLEVVAGIRTRFAGIDAEYEKFLPNSLPAGNRGSTGNWSLPI